MLLIDSNTETCIVQFKDKENNVIENILQVDVNCSQNQLTVLLGGLLANEDDSTIYSFSVKDKLSDNIIYLGASMVLNDLFIKANVSKEETLQIIYAPLEVNQVRPVTRCTATLEGHTDAILCLSFSPDCNFVATGSGDTTVRLWDLNTETPYHILKEHTKWVFSLAWSDCSNMLASGGQDSKVCIWFINEVQPYEIRHFVMKKHTKAVTYLAWESTENNPHPRLASSALDFKIYIWDSKTGHCLQCLNTNSMPTTCIQFSRNLNETLLYAAGRDSYLDVWDVNCGKRIKHIKAHGHWINCFSYNKQSKDQKLKCKTFKKKSTEGMIEDEVIVTASDDCTLGVCNPLAENQVVTKLHGHSKPVNDVQFSPNNNYIASASFDGCIKLWDAKTNKYIATLFGHVGPVYKLSWSPDSKFLVSASADSTVKVWNVQKKSLQEDLPGHADQVYVVDWSSDGRKVASGSKDRMVKFWSH